MKKSLLLLCLILGLMPLLSAQDTDADLTAEDIASYYVEAIGGTAAWKAVRNMRTESKMSMMGMEFPAKVITAAPNLFRLDVDVMGQQMIQSYDGETAWQVMPMMGISTPTRMSEAEALQVNQNELLNEFIDYEARGYTLELRDAREVEGIATQGVRITDGKDKDLTYYFDLETFVPIMMEITIKEGPLRGAVVETYFSDYREITGGLILPFFTEVKNAEGSQKIIIESVEINVAVAEGFFGLPEKK